MTVWEKTVEILALNDSAAGASRTPETGSPEEARALELSQQGEAVPF
jgi:hypothetical protein